MPHVSKHYIKKDIYENIFSNFVEVLCSIKNKKESRLLMNSLFSKTERLMFAKRLGIVFLLEEGVSHYGISKMLMMSESTVSRISLKYEEGDFDFLIKFFKNKKSFGNFLRQILSIIPPRGKGRWDFLDKHF